MAKIGLQDERVTFIEYIGRTENLKVLRNISSSMFKLSYNFNLNMSEIQKILNEGCKRIENLLGETVKDFYPYSEMIEKTPLTYFLRVVDGLSSYNKYLKKCNEIEKLTQEYEQKLYSYKEKNRSEKVKEYELRLKALESPIEMEEILNENLKSYEAKVLNGGISIDDFTKIQRYIKKILKDCNKAKKIEKGVSETLVYYKKIQEEIRNYLCYCFYERESSSLTPNQLLMSYDGEIILDFEHLIVLYNYLKSKNYSRLNEVEAVLVYFALEDYCLSVLPQVNKNGTNIVVLDGPTEFFSQSVSNYNRKYFMSYALEENYVGYCFEPSNLLQQAFIASIDSDDLNINSMVQEYRKAQSIMKTQNTGIFFKFLDKDLENKLVSKLLTESFNLTHFNGKYGTKAYKEFLKRRNSYGDLSGSSAMTNLYTRIVTPFALEVLGSYVRMFTENLRLLKDKSMIYFYYVSPQRVALAVRKDVTKEMLLEVFDKKFIENLKEIEKPTLESIVNGDFL